MPTRFATDDDPYNSLTVQKMLLDSFFCSVFPSPIIRCSLSVSFRKATLAFASVRGGNPSPQDNQYICRLVAPLDW